MNQTATKLEKNIMVLLIIINEVMELTHKYLKVGSNTNANDCLFKNKTENIDGCILGLISLISSASY